MLLAANDTVLPGFGFRHPFMLPNSRALLFTGVDGLSGLADLTQAGVFSLDVATGKRTLLLPNAMEPRYVETGHLLFMREGTLMAVNFDPDRLEVRGDPVIVLDDVMHATGMPSGSVESGDAQVAISSAGHIAYARGGVFPLPPARLMRVSMNGTSAALDVEPNTFTWLRVSPDGTRLAFAIKEPGSSNSWSLFVRDFARRVSEPVNTGGEGRDAMPAWSPDGRYIAFTSKRAQAADNIYRIAADGSGEPERLAPSSETQAMMSWSSQGGIAYQQAGDIWILPPNGKPAPFFTSKALERFATFSPDGRWLAYVSDLSDRPEVYVRPYPGPGPASLVSSAGGIAPAWSPDGRHLYFLEQRADRLIMMSAEVVAGANFRSNAAIPLIDPWPYYVGQPARSHDVLADGSFLASLTEEGGNAAGTLTSSQQARATFKVTELHIVMNFFEELRARQQN